MFARATTNFVSEIDPSGCLIAVSSLIDSDKLRPLSLIIKRKRFWFWQRPKYQPSDFTLNDVLTADNPITPVVTEREFVTYSESCGDSIQAKAEAKLGPGNGSIEGKDTCKLKTSFGNLKKCEVDVQKLLRDSKDRVLDLQHSLIQQTMEKKNAVFGLVKEFIVTTQPCSVTEEVQEEAGCGVFLNMSKLKRIQVSVTENGQIQTDVNVSEEIPVNTVLAYSLTELEVKSSGHYELCLLRDTSGGFEVDGPIVKKGMVGISCDPVQQSKLPLQEETAGLQTELRVMRDLPAATRSSLFQHLHTLMQDRVALSKLESIVHGLCLGESPDRVELDQMLPVLAAEVKLVLTLLEESGGAAGPQCQTSASTAVYMLISALDELPDWSLSLLSSCLTSPSLQALLLLVQGWAEQRRLCVKDSGLNALADEEVYERVCALFSSCDGAMKREEDSLIITHTHHTHQPLLLYVAITGLACLGLAPQL
ncbi:gasdermin Eb [Chanos chanos]|uniref:Gasdermin Eb n=1 Tax=Chanos chanos TaxID=29144 RepID=A0A6J2W4V6_CHACN|nr:gasdermin-E-like [Chanos chanos]